METTILEMATELTVAVVGGAAFHRIGAGRGPRVGVPGHRRRGWRARCRGLVGIRGCCRCRRRAVYGELRHGEVGEVKTAAEQVADEVGSQSA